MVSEPTSTGGDCSKPTYNGCMSDPRPVGVFDSGIGGVTVLRHVRAQYPNERCIYLADTRYAPYGTREPDFVRERCRRVVDFLLERSVKVIVVACNTASVLALSDLRSRYKVPFVGIVPGVKPAAQLTRSGTIGVLATPMTVESDSLASLIASFAGGATVVTRECPGLVELIDRGIVDGPEVEQLLRPCLDPMLAAGADVIGLGCTHFPFAAPLIQRICGTGVTLLDPADAVALQLGRVLLTEGLAAEDSGGPPCFFTTGDPESFEAVYSVLVGPLDGPLTQANF